MKLFLLSLLTISTFTSINFNQFLPLNQVQSTSTNRIKNKTHLTLLLPIAINFIYISIPIYQQKKHN